MEFYFLIGFILLQRMGEMVWGNRNLAKNENLLSAPIDQSEKITMLLLHSSWFVSTLVEYYTHGQLVRYEFWMAGLFILALCQLLRFLSVYYLKEHWVPYPASFKGQPLIEKGPYRHLRHPNYLAVLIEIPLIPLLGQCYFTSLFFGIFNFIFIMRRIKIEEMALNDVSHYQERFKMKKKFIPFVFSLIFSSFTFAETITFSSKDYDAAKASESFFMFVGESTKLGLITTEFDGYVKSATLDFVKKKNSVRDLVLKIDTTQIDTDNSSRDEKMRDLCLESSKHPQITITAKKISIIESEQEVPAEMNIKGKILPLKLSIKKVSNHLFKGSSSFKLSEAGIADPSIAVASVKDKFKINFQITMPK